MKSVFVGGGAVRHLAILRGALATGIYEDGHIVLQDLNVTRAKAVADLLRKSPEGQKSNCKISWDLSLPKALQGADSVSMVLLAGSFENYQASCASALRHGFLGSDNISISGGFLAVKGGGLMMDIARKMEQYCPNAWLLDFVNPIAVFTAMVNNHTRIKAMGVCAGFVNHQWDISRLLGEDKQVPCQVDVAGVNHLSFILRGTRQGQDILATLDRRLAEGPISAPKLGSRWTSVQKQAMRRGIKRLADIYRELGALIFSTESDGMGHLMHETFYKQLCESGHNPVTRAQVKTIVNKSKVARDKADAAFTKVAASDLDDAFWKKQDEQGTLYAADHEDIFVKCLKAIARQKPVDLVATHINNGAITGVSDRTVVEYSMRFSGKRLTPGKNLEVPASVRGMVHSIASHQTLLADAIVHQDPHLFAQAMLCYPIQPYSTQLRKALREQLAVTKAQIPAVFQQAVEYL